MEDDNKLPSDSGVSAIPQVVGQQKDPPTCSSGSGIAPVVGQQKDRKLMKQARDKRHNEKKKLVSQQKTAEIARLNELVSQLQGTNAQLATTIERQSSDNTQLVAANARLVNTNAQLVTNNTQLVNTNAQLVAALVAGGGEHPVVDQPTVGGVGDASISAPLFPPIQEQPFGLQQMMPAQYAAAQNVNLPAQEYGGSIATSGVPSTSGQQQQPPPSIPSIDELWASKGTRQ